MAQFDYGQRRGGSALWWILGGCGCLAALAVAVVIVVVGLTIIGKESGPVGPDETSSASPADGTTPTPSDSAAPPPSDGGTPSAGGATAEGNPVTLTAAGESDVAYEGAKVWPVTASDEAAAKERLAELMQATIDKDWDAACAATLDKDTSLGVTADSAHHQACVDFMQESFGDMQPPPGEIDPSTFRARTGTDVHLIEIHPFSDSSNPSLLARGADGQLYVLLPIY